MKKRFLMSSLALFIGGLSLNAQTWDWVQKIEGTTGSDNVTVKAVDVDVAGNSYVTGYYTGEFLSSAALQSVQQDGFIAKYDGTGTLQWIYKFGGPGNDAGNSISVETSTTNPCFYVTGYVQYNDPLPVVFVGGATSVTLPLVSSCVGATAPNNVYLRGGLSSRQAFIAKYNLAGTLQWVRPMYAPGCLDAEGLSVCASYRHLSGDNYERNVYVTGYFEGNSMSFQNSAACSFITINGNTGGRTAFVAKFLGTTGNASWARSLAVPTSTNASSVGKSVLVDFIPPNTTNLLITGNFRNFANFTTTTLNATDPAVYVANLNASGTYQWGTTITASGASADIEARDLACRPGINNNELFAYGDFSGTQVNGGGVGYGSGGGRDLYFFQLNKSTGAVNFGRADGGSDNQWAYGADLNYNAGASAHELYVSGAYDNSVAFNGGSAFGSSGTSTLEHFMARYDMSLNYVCATHWDGSLNLGTNTIDAADVAAAKTTTANAAYVGGFFQSIQNPVFSPYTLSTGNPSTGFISKWLCCECPPPSFTIDRPGKGANATISFTYPPCDNTSSLFMLNYRLGASSSTLNVLWGTPTVAVSGLAINLDYHWATLNACQVQSPIQLGRSASVGHAGDPDKSFNVFPNPTDQSLSIEALESGTVELFDMSGRLVLQKKIVNPQAKDQLDVSGLANGSYVLKYSSGSGVNTRKIQIMH